MSADTAIMPIPGPIDPVPVPRAVKPREDGRVELVGLSKDQIRAALEAAGLEPKQAKLRVEADLALDLQSRSHRLRGDERHRQGPARRGSPSGSRSPGPKWSRRRSPPTARANGC